MVKGKSYRIKGSGQYVSPSQVDAKKKVHIESGKPVIEDWEKMSKSKHNGVDPGMFRILILFHYIISVVIRGNCR